VNAGAGNTLRWFLSHCQGWRFEIRIILGEWLSRISEPLWHIRCVRKVYTFHTVLVRGSFRWLRNFLLFSDQKYIAALGNARYWQLSCISCECVEQEVANSSKGEVIHLGSCLGKTTPHPKEECLTKCRKKTSDLWNQCTWPTTIFLSFIIAVHHFAVLLLFPYLWKASLDWEVCSVV